jgi:hypothetical protein
MIVTEPKMRKKLVRALKQGNNLYDLNDIENALAQGSMQGHVNGDTWAVTQVHDWPHRRSVEILFVVGNLHEAVMMEEKLEDWARAIGATMITAVGREGWWNHKTPGWKKVGVLYSKDI